MSKSSISQVADDIRAQRLGMFHTYVSVSNVMAYIEQLSSSERALATTIMGLTLNATITQIADGLDNVTAEENQ